MSLAEVIDFLQFKKGHLENEIETSLKQGKVDTRAVRELLRTDKDNETAVLGASAARFVKRDYETSNSLARAVLEKNPDNLGALKLYLLTGVLLLERRLVKPAEYAVFLAYYRNKYPEEPNILLMAQEYFESQRYVIEKLPESVGFE